MLLLDPKAASSLLPETMRPPSMRHGERKLLLWTAPSHYETAEYHFYGALARAAASESATQDSRSQHLTALVEHHKQLALWAENCPENFENRAALVGAEIARIQDRELDAERSLRKGIRSSHAHGFVHNEALASELAARFYAARGFESNRASVSTEGSGWISRLGSHWQSTPTRWVIPAAQSSGNRQQASRAPSVHLSIN